MFLRSSGKSHPGTDSYNQRGIANIIIKEAQTDILIKDTHYTDYHNQRGTDNIIIKGEQTIL